MATPFRLKRSSISGKRPLIGDLELGELALNFYDGYLFARRDTDGVGIADTVSLLNPWVENYGGSSIHYLQSVGIGTTSPSEILTVHGNSYVSGNFNTQSLFASTITSNNGIFTSFSILGISTFSGDVDINAAIDVDGHTELDELNVTGISTFTADLDINAAIDVDGHTELDQLNVSGVSTFVGITTVESTLFTNQLNVAGLSTFSADLDINAAIDVDGHTELDELNVAGVSTFASDLDINAAIDVDGHTELDELNVAGISTFASDLDINAAIDVDGHTELDELNVAGVATFASAIDANGGLDVLGHTELDSLNVSGIATFASLDVQTNFDVYDSTATFHNNVHITGNLSIGGTTTVLQAQDLKIFDKDIILGVTTDSNGEDISTDITANHAGVAVASTEGHPLVDLFLEGLEELPTTYKKIMWFSEGSFSGLGTDAWLFNYAVGIGSTQFPTGTRLAVGEVQITDDAINSPQLIVSGVSTFSGNVDVNAAIDVDGHTELDELNVSGVSTFSADLDINAAIDVDGHTELDQLNVSGVSTFAADLDINAAIDVDGHTELDELNVAGVSTFAADLDINAAIDVDGHTELDELNVAGVSTFASDLDINAAIDVDGHTELDELRVSGVSTFVGVATFTDSNVYIDNQLFVGGIQINGGAGGGSSFAGVVTFTDTTNNTLGDSNTGALQIDGGVGIDKNLTVGAGLNIGETLNVTGVSTFSGDLDINAAIDVDGHTELDELRVSGVSTFGNNIDANGDLDVDGHTELDQLNVSGISTFNGTTEVKNSSFKVTNSTASGQYLEIVQNGDSSLNLNKVGSGSFFIEGNNIFLGDASSSESYAGFWKDGKVNLNFDGSTKLETTGYGVTIFGGLNVSGITTYQDTTDNTLGDADTGAFQIDGGLGVNKNVTVGGNLNVQGYSELVGVVTFKGGTINIGDADSDDINVGGEFISSLIPNDDATYVLGTSSKRWRDGNFSDILTTNNLYAAGITTTVLFNVGVGGTVITTTETGLVGINSTSPTTTLDVGGTINSNTDVTINGTSVLSTAENDAVALAIALG